MAGVAITQEKCLCLAGAGDTCVEKESRVDSIYTGGLDVSVADGGRVGALEVARKRVSISQLPQALLKLF